MLEPAPVLLRQRVRLETQVPRVGVQVAASDGVMADLLETLALERAEVVGLDPGTPSRFLDGDAEIFARRPEGRSDVGGSGMRHQRHLRREGSCLEPRQV